MVFLQKKNIAKWTNLETAAKKVGLDVLKFKQDYEGKAKELFNEDLKLARELGVRGFPTLFFNNINGNSETMYGSKPYIALVLDSTNCLSHLLKPRHYTLEHPIKRQQLHCVDHYHSK